MTQTTKVLIHNHAGEIIN